VPIEDDELAAVRAEIKRLQARLAELEATVSLEEAPVPRSEAAESAHRNQPSPPVSGERLASGLVKDARQGSDRRPVRAMVLDVLEDTGMPTYSREIAQLFTALYGRSVSSSRFGALSADEAGIHISDRPRSVYLGHALTAERFEPIKRLWIRSDWPLTERVMASTTSRTRHLRMTMKLCDLAEKYADHAADPAMLKILAADHAADLPGIKVRRGEFPLREWRAIAADLLAELEPRDTLARVDAADRLAELAEHHQLFGPPQVISVTDTVPTATNREQRRVR
jgi:hypothetical protein